MADNHNSIQYNQLLWDAHPLLWSMFQDGTNIVSMLEGFGDLAVSGVWTIHLCLRLFGKGLMYVYIYYMYIYIMWCVFYKKEL